MSPKFQYLTAFRMSTAVGARAIQFATPPRISLWSSTTALTAFLLGATLPLVALEPFLAINMDGINQESAVDVASSHNGQDECATEHCRGTQIEETGGKGVTMLLSSVPIAMKQEAIFTRELTCVQLVYKVFKQFQPGD